MPIEQTCNDSMQAICREELNHVLKAHISDNKVDDMCVTKALINNNSNNHCLVKAETETDQLHGFNIALLQQNLKADEANTIDLFPTHATTWQQNPMNSQEYAHLRLDLSSTSKLLLQSSDDPLICRGAVDAHDEDHPLEFKTVIAKKNRQQQQQQQQQQQHFTNHHHQARLSYQAELKAQPKVAQTTSGCSSLTKQQLKAKASQMSAQNRNQNSMPTTSVEQQAATTTPKAHKKSAIKLRFHHQALPPEYRQHDTSHGQQQQQQQQHVSRNGASTRKSSSFERSTATTSLQAAVGTKSRPPTKNAQENVRSWLQKIAEIQRSAEQQKQQQQQQHHHAQQEQKSDINNNNYQTDDIKHNTSSSANGPIGKRHHRIAPTTITTTTATDMEANEHILKYSNLPYMGEITLHNSKPRRGRKPKKADICHLIYKNYGTIVPGATIKDKIGMVNANVNASANANALLKFDKGDLGNQEIEIDDNEPLNLCLRDQSTDSFSISSSDECDKCPEPTNRAITCSMPLNSSGHAFEVADTAHAHEPLESTKLAQLTTDVDASTTSLIQHSISLYYQSLLESGILLQEDGQTLRIPIETIEKDNQLALKIPIPNGFLSGSTKVVKPPISPSVSTTSTELASTTLSLKSESTAASSSLAPAANLHIQLVPPKRKRSAIFIPPMPAENSSNPPTEVSICKFKFTGGAKPTLQEKKMLSVDADGNYRFYNGAAEKANCECLPREHVAQHGLPSSSSASLYNTISVSDKIFVDIPPPSADLSHELLQIPPESPTSVLLQPVSAMLLPHSPMHRAYPNAQSPKAAKLNVIETPAHVQVTTTERKRKFRRSTQREKFEKNFSEKGFLIQTQQLESAEGSTYCKFRQLKKFTRYLFRNWKDYLPNSELSNNRHAIHPQQHSDRLSGIDKETMKEC